MPRNTLPSKLHHKETENLYTPTTNKEIESIIINLSTEKISGLEKLKQNCFMTQEFHFWVYIQYNWRQRLNRCLYTHVYAYSSTFIIAQRWKNPIVFQWMNGETKCGIYTQWNIQFSKFSGSVISDSLPPHGLQHARLPCPSPTPGACKNSCPSSWWCHPTVSSSVVPFSSCLQSFPASGSFPMNESALCIRWPKYWSVSFNIRPSNDYSVLISFWIDWFDLLSVQETLKSLLQHHSSEASTLLSSAFFMIRLSHPYMTTGKTIALLDWPLSIK